MSSHFFWKYQRAIIYLFPVYIYRWIYCTKKTLPLSWHTNTVTLSNIIIIYKNRKHIWTHAPLPIALTSLSDYIYIYTKKNTINDCTIKCIKYTKLKIWKWKRFILYTYNIFGCEWINSENTPSNNLYHNTIILMW